MSDEYHDPGRGPEALYEGGRHGRIYRITPESENPAPWVPSLAPGPASDRELVEFLDHPNAWWRTHAQRMLVDRRSREAVDPLREMFGSSPRPDTRLHALWTLEGLGGLTTSDIRAALKDPEPGIRENAIRLAEPRLDQEPALAQDLLAMTGDAHPAVRFQLLCTLGWLDSPSVRRARRQLLLRDMEDPWVQLAALSASAPRPLELLELAVSEFSGSASKQRVEFFSADRDARRRVGRSFGDRAALRIGSPGGASRVRTGGAPPVWRVWPGGFGGNRVTIAHRASRPAVCWSWPKRPHRCCAARRYSCWIWRRSR